MKRNRTILISAALVFVALVLSRARGNDFTNAVSDYGSGDFNRAAEGFSKETKASPSSGAFQNLGNAYWKSGRTADAILAWERARWLDPYDGHSRSNLVFARNIAQLESPTLAWHEVASTWLPSGVWLWIAAGSLWVALGALVLPGVLRRGRASWHQAVAALGFCAFILSVPANLGVRSRCKIGFVMSPETSLRLTPTANAETVTRLGAGQPLRTLRARGEFVLVQSGHAQGWLHRDELNLICQE